MADFIPYGRQWVDEDDVRAVTQVLRSAFLTQGPKVEEFENKIAEYTGAEYCVAVSNGTAALHMAVGCLELPRGSEGITSPITFVASANCMANNGLIPRFADIDQKTYNIDPSKIGEALTEETRLLIPVHFAGQAAPMADISRIAGARSLFVVEDASHAIGSTYGDGSRVGNCRYSDLTTFSFHPVKTITAGEGGAITTNSRELYERLLLIRSHGITRNREELSTYPGPWYYEMQREGYNYRLSDIQAALGVSQFSKLEQYKEQRRRLVDRYNEAFKDVRWITRPYEEPGLDSCFHLYVIQIDLESIKKSRAEVMETLMSKGIGTQVHYIPVHTHPFYRVEYGYDHGDFPISESYYGSALSIPLFPKMTFDEQERVIRSILDLNE